MRSLFNLGSTSSQVVALLKRYNSLTHADLVRKLAWLQVQKLLPVAPFSISEKGEIKSTVVEASLKNLEELGYLESEEPLALTTKAETVFQGVLDNLPNEIKPYETNIPSTRKSIIKIGKNNFELVLNASIDTIRFSALLPACVDLGLIFSLPLENSMNGFLPLEVTKDQMIAYFLQSTSANERSVAHPSISKAIRMQKRIQHYFHQMIPDQFEKRGTSVLRVLLYSLLSYCNVYDISWCGQHEHRDETKREIDLFIRPPTNVCPQCYGQVIERYVVLKNPKIAADWLNGALMDWYVCQILRSLGFRSAYWFCTIDGLECDVLAVNGRNITICECKRTRKYGADYKKGIGQLKNLRKLFETKGSKIQTLLVTAIPGKPRDEEGISKVITRTNFAHIKDEIFGLIG